MKILEKIRKEANLTIEQTAAYSGVAAGLISQIEQGKSDNFKFTTIEKLSNLFPPHSDEIHKAGKRIPRDIFFRLVDSKKSFDEIRGVLNAAKI